MRKIIQTILMVIIITVCGHIVVSNVEHMIYLNTKTYDFNFENASSLKEIKSSIQNIETNLTKMDNLTNSPLSSEELTYIKTEIGTFLTAAKNLSFLSYNSSNNIMTETEFYKLTKTAEDFGVASNIKIYKTLAKYNTSLNEDDFEDLSFMQMLQYDFIVRDVIENYKYPKSLDFVNMVNIKGLAFMNYVSNKINTVEYLSNLVIESGDINE